MRYLQGIFKPINKQKYVGDVNNIVYRSSWELKLLRWCDSNPSVLKYASEEIAIPYYSKADKKSRRYFVDFIIKFLKQDDSVETWMVEVKPHAQSIPPVRGRKKDKTYLKELYNWSVNSDKWEAAKEFAEKIGMKFVVLDEYDLGIKKK